MLKRGQILVDGSVCNDENIKPSCGSRVDYLIGKKRAHYARQVAKPPELTLEWVHVDNDMAVCVKPSGVAVMGDESATRLRAAVNYELPPSDGVPDALPTPRAVHRIDKATGGLLVWARTHSAAASLSQAFAEHHGVVAKTYLALVAGKLEGEGCVDAPLHGKRALSRWKSLSCVRSARSGWVTTLRLHPETGRQHQLRRHLAHELGCPILGDPKYCTNDSRHDELEEMYLWALEIALPHPATGAALRIVTEEPPHFEARRRLEVASAGSG